MNDLDRLLKQINQMTAPVRQIMDAIDSVIPPYIQRLNEAVAPAVQRIT